MAEFDACATASKNPEKKKKAGEVQLPDKILFSNRTLTLFDEITPKTAHSAIRQLLALDRESSQPILLYISSPGGHVESGDAVFDIIRSIQAPVLSIGTGWVGSIATHIFLAPDKKHRFSLPNTRFLIHQPAGQIGGTAADVSIHAKEILKIRSRINKIIAEQTGQKLEKVNQDTLRDYWMDAKEAEDYGLVGKVVKTLSEVST